MRVNSSELLSKIHWVCNDCGTEALKLPENSSKHPFEVSTYHNGKCDVCGKHKSVTEARDFRYPVFEIKEGRNGD